MTLEEFGKSDKKLCIFLSKRIMDKIELLVCSSPYCFVLPRNGMYMEFSETPYLLLNKKAWFENSENNLEKMCKKYMIDEYIDQEISILGIKEFNELLLYKIDDNHEKDVFDYNMVKDLITIAKMKIQTKCMLIINKDKKYVIYKVNNKECRVDCHNDDKFDWQIGFGLALSKFYGNQYKWQRARENFRNTITDDNGSVKRVLDYESYSKWCIYEYYHNDTDDMANLVQRVKEINELGKVDL